MDGRTAGPVVTGTSAPLVGRQDALTALRGAMAASRRDGFQFLALVGEPGAGKTRLLGELAAMAGGDGFTPLWGRAAEYEQMLPYSALVDALDDHLDARREEVVRAVGSGQAALLSGVFPGLAADGGPAGDEPTLADDRSGLARYRLYRAVRHLVGALAGPTGLLLVLDDVHWADDGTLEFLDHVVRHPPAGPVLMAVAFRPAQAAPRVARLAAAAGPRGHEVVVGPLSATEVRQFLGPDVSRGRGMALYEASGGNPFYLEALARMGGTDVAELPPTVLAALPRSELATCPPARCWWPRPPPWPPTSSNRPSPPWPPRCRRPPRWPRWTSWSSATSSAARAGGSASATPSCDAPSTSRRRRAGAWARTPGSRPTWPSWAPRRPYRPTTSSIPGRSATNGPWRCWWPRPAR
ncbi:AAA family ATPase [Microbispora sp. GKU 823]|uniref:ATP-binding protein n=1 Tax=Microbispora sp. GKU 823 TaxID=1652100 RepID=UPI0009A3EBB8|nr:ATP-binding protein [Microbispora sp. GKU 823]OPG08633.1 hypothetical protein B1L11_27705 [Microbispora sp. GKU 823]